MELTTEVCVIALVVAVALLWLLLSGKREERPTTEIVEGTLLPLEGYAGGDELSLNAIDDGVVEIHHRSVPLAEGDTVNLVMTVTGTNVAITEKAGLRGSGPTTAREVLATLRLPTCYPHTVRFDSQLTGQWAVATFTPTMGQTITATMKM